MANETNGLANPPLIGAPNFLFGLSRAECAMLAMVVALCNATLPTVLFSLEPSFFFALSNTFGISAIVWYGVYCGMQSLSRIDENGNNKIDRAVVLATLASCLLPLGPAMWVGVSALSGYLLFTAPSRQNEQARAGWIFLAISIPMFWSKNLFIIFSEFFLKIDAILVSSITLTERTGNIVAMPGGDGYLQIAAACSSMANISLAILCWVIFTQTANITWRPTNFLWVGLMCLSVTAINITRITLIGYFPHYYEVLHGPLGSTVAGYLYIAAMMFVCYLKLRADRAAAVSVKAV